MPDNETHKFYQVLPGSPQENVTLEKNDGMYVMQGGYVTGTVISGGTMVVSEGGKASTTTVAGADGTAGSLTVQAGGSADIVTVGSDGELYVSGKVTSATVSQGGTATVYEDCQAKNFIISSGGELNLSAGATVYQISNGSIVTSNVIVKSGGSLFLFEGTWIEGVEFSGGYASINKNAIMSSAIFSSGGSATVRDGALVEKATVNDGAVLTVLSGGVVKDTTLNIGGKITGNMYNCSGIKSNVGIIDFNIVVNDPEDGYFINDLSTFFNSKSDPMLSFYTVTATMDQANGTYKLIQNADGFAEDKTVSIVNYYNAANVLGTITIQEGTKTIEGRQYTLNLSSDNELTITVFAPDFTGDLYRPFDLTEGKFACDVDVYEGGKLNILELASADETTVHRGGIVNVSAGGEANGVMVDIGGRLNVSAGGIATLVKENGGFVDAAGNVEFATNTFTGLALDSEATVHSGTTANKTVINAGGVLHVYDGGRAVNTTVNADGALHVSRGGVADGLLVMPNGNVTIASGTITGWIMLAAGATVTASKGAILDFDLAQTAAGAAMPLVNNLSLVTGTPACTLTVTGREADGTYNLAGSAAGFDKTITVKNASGTELGTISVDGGTQTINGRSYTLDLTDGLLSVTIVQPESVNDKLFIDNKTVNTDVTDADGKVLSAPGQEIEVDKAGTVSDEEGIYQNSVDKDDAVDYGKIVLEHGAKLSFHVTATAAATFTAYSLTEKNGKYSLKKLQTLKLADKDNDGVFTADSSKLVSLSASGSYYVSMKFTDKDKSKTAYYNVSLNGEESGKPSEFYPLGDNTDDWGDMKTSGYAGAVGDLGKITDTSLYLTSGEWIGFGDKVDYKKFTLDSAAELSFSVSAPDGPLQFSVCKLKETVKNGVTTYSQVAIKSVVVKAGDPKSLNNLRLVAGDYYFKVESLNVNKSTEYGVQIIQNDFYDDGDSGWNNVLITKKALHENAKYFYDNTLSVSGSIHLDKTGDYKKKSVAAEYKRNGETYGGFVCFGDEIDYAKITLSEGTKKAEVAFTLSATNNATLEIIKVTQSGAKYTKKSLKTAKYKAGTISAVATAKVRLEAKENVTYYVSVKATNIKKTTVDPRTYYNVSYEVLLTEAASSLAMPETSDALAMTDSLNFGNYGADVLADASASSIAELNDKSAWQNSLLA